MSSRGPQTLQRPFPFQAKTNLFQVNVDPRGVFVQYQVDINPPVPQARRADEILEKLQSSRVDKFTPRAIYDGRAVMFSTNPNLGDTYRVRMSANPARGNYEVAIRQVATIRTNDIKRAISASHALPVNSDRDVLNLLQLIIKQAPNKRHKVTAQAKFFLSSSRAHTLGNGLEACRGFFQSVRPVISRLLINVDVIHVAVYQGGDLMDLALSFFGTKVVRELQLEPTSPKFRRLQLFLKGVRIKSKFPQNGFNTAPFRPITKLVSRAGRFEFTAKEGEPTTVERYFKEKYNYTLKYPDILGADVRGAVHPLEVCSVAYGQCYRRNLSESQQREMLQYSKLQPAERLQLIEGAVTGRNQQFDYEMSDYMKASGMQVNTEPLAITGRVLEHPMVMYASPHPVRLNRGGWNVKGQRFAKAQMIRSWVVVNFDYETSRHDVQAFVTMLAENLVKLGIYDKSFGLPKIRDGNLQNPDTTLDGCRDVLPKFILVLLPRDAPVVRHKVKFWGNFVRNVATQCVRGGKYKANDQYCNNVALKIHAKVGGINSFTRSQAMGLLKNGLVVGCDVSHPAPGITNKPSVASLVSSLDEEGALYTAHTSIQHPRTEMIADIRDMLMSAIKEYRKQAQEDKVDRRLERVIVYRDGVSEGEFEQVRQQEIGPIKELLRTIPEDLRAHNPPQLVYIVVTKRHHVRFFPAQQLGVEKDGNCPSGFVVDRDIVYSSLPDFYLQSHAGLLGTSRPSHYVVLENELQLDINTLQSLSFSLCHNYAAATRVVSIPTPVYYADLACSYMEYHMPAKEESSDMSSNHEELDLEMLRKNFRMTKLNSKLYFL